MSVSVRPVLWDLPAMCHISLFGKPALIFMGVASPVLRQCYAFEFIISAMRATLPCTLAAASCFRTENQHIALQERSVLRGMPYTTYPEFEHGFCKSSSLTLSRSLCYLALLSTPFCLNISFPCNQVDCAYNYVRTNKSVGLLCRVLLWILKVTPGVYVRASVHMCANMYVCMYVCI